MNKEKLIKKVNILISKSNDYCPKAAEYYLISLRSNLFGCYLFDFIDRETYVELVTLINAALFNVCEEYLV